MPARKVEPSAIEKRQFRDELPAGGDGTPPLHRCGQASVIVRFVLMPDGHHISCPNGGKKYGKETPFIGGLRSPLTIPENGPFEILFRTVGNYPENDIAFFEIAPNQHRQAKRSLPEGSLSAPESLTP